MCNDTTHPAVSVEERDETGSYRATFDSVNIDPSVATVEVMAHVYDVDPLQLDPLHDYVDTESIDGLGTRSTHGSREGDHSIEFTYLGFDVTVTSDGVIEVEPVSANGE